MRTTRTVTVRGISLTGTPLLGQRPLDRDPLDRDSLDRYPLDRDPHRDTDRDPLPGQRPPWIEIPWTETPWTETLWTETPMDKDPLDRDPHREPPPPPQWTESQTGVKTLPTRNFIAGGNKFTEFSESSITGISRLAMDTFSKVLPLCKYLPFTGFIQNVKGNASGPLRNSRVCSLIKSKFVLQVGHG